MRSPTILPKNLRQQLNKNLKADRLEGDDPWQFDPVQMAADLREIFAQAQRDLEAGKGYDVTMDDLRRDFERDAMRFKESRDAWQRERERRAREQERRAREQRRRGSR